MQPSANYGTEPAREEIDIRFNQVLAQRVYAAPLLPDQYSTDPVPARRVPDPRRLAQQRPVR